MKRALILTVSLAFSLFTMAQVKGYPTVYSEYKDLMQKEYPEKSPMDIHTNYWQSYYHTEGGEFGKMEYYASLADTLINDRRYMKVVAEGKDTLLFRQEGDKVFLFREGQELLLMDYGLKEGDSFVNPWGEKFVVTKSFTFDSYAKYYGSWRKCLSLYTSVDSPKVIHLQSLEDEGLEDEWMEGIGSVEWGIIPLQILQTLNLLPEKPERTHLIHGSSRIMYSHFEVIEEDYAMIPFEPTRCDYASSYTFSGDTLCVKDYCPLSGYGCSAECTIKDDVIDLKAYSVSDATDVYPKNFNIRIPGLKAGTYKIYMNGILRSDSLVCKGTNGVEAIDSGRRTMDNDAPTYDLSGRCISVPSVSSASSVLPKGVYIRNGRKVVMLE